MLMHKTVLEGTLPKNPYKEDVPLVSCLHQLILCLRQRSLKALLLCVNCTLLKLPRELYTQISHYCISSLFPMPNKLLSEHSNSTKMQFKRSTSDGSMPFRSTV